jgi:hypothetical protein
LLGCAHAVPKIESSTSAFDMFRKLSNQCMPGIGLDVDDLELSFGSPLVNEFLWIADGLKYFLSEACLRPKTWLQERPSDGRRTSRAL